MFPDLTGVNAAVKQGVDTGQIKKKQGFFSGLGGIIGQILGQGVGYRPDDEFLNEVNRQSEQERRAAQTQNIIIILVVVAVLGGLIYFITKGKK